MREFMHFLKLVLFVFFVTILGCKESSFELSEESRLPAWFEVPDGMTRTELGVTLDYYIGSEGRKAVFKLKDENNRVLQKATGIQLGLEPKKLKNQPEGFPARRPLYEVITVDGKTDIVEHRVRGPVFHMTDDASIWKEFGFEQN
jgi:hypothetical protein